MEIAFMDQRVCSIFFFLWLEETYAEIDIWIYYVYTFTFAFKISQ